MLLSPVECATICIVNRHGVLLSGGVDSATALMRLVARGEKNITAYYLKIWLEDELSYMGDCPWEEDLGYARAVCEHAGVPLKVVSLQQEYYDRVVSYALDELRAGRTPSPDIFCNQRIKFGAFFERLGTEVDTVVSGHYAQIERRSGEVRLLRAPDPVKDQTYFLSHLSSDQLARLEFPIGELTKKQVRALAEEYTLPNRNRPDSQGICFLGKIRYPDFVRHYLGEREGDIVERETGTVLGKHRGFWFHTIGQRQGLGLGNGPWYVVGKNPAENLVYVSHATHKDEQVRHEFLVEDHHWISGCSPLNGAGSRSLQAKLRHGPELQACVLSVPPDPRHSGLLRVELRDGDRGVAPGQFAVFYEGEQCLGAAKISAEGLTQ